MKNKYEIKSSGGWFSIFNVATGELRHIGGVTRTLAERMLANVIFLDTPAGKAEDRRCNTHRNNFTGD